MSSALTASASVRPSKKVLPGDAASRRHENVSYPAVVASAGILWRAAGSALHGGIAWIAAATQVHYVLFPELGALAHDVIKRLHGTWAKTPGMLVLTPLLTGLVGAILVQSMGSGIVPILLAIAAAILIIRALQSPIASAISAGVLAISLNITSWHYPASLLIGLALLAAISLIWRRIVAPPPARTPVDVADDMTEEAPRSYSWFPFFEASGCFLSVRPCCLSPWMAADSVPTADRDRL